MTLPQNNFSRENGARSAPTNHVASGKDIVAHDGIVVFVRASPCSSQIIGMRGEVILLNEGRGRGEVISGFFSGLLRDTPCISGSR